MECVFCFSKPCICDECEEAEIQGRHCGQERTTVENPYDPCTQQYGYWRHGFNKGKEDLKNRTRQLDKE